MLRTLPILSEKNDNEESDVEIRVVNGGNTPMDGFPCVTCWRYDTIPSYLCEIDKEYDFIRELFKLLHVELTTDIDMYQSEEWYRQLLDALKHAGTMREVRNLYLRKFPGGHNSYSMMVHSHSCGTFGESDSLVSNDFSCLYTGDAELKGNQDVAHSIKDLSPHYIQVPHHGSSKNHDLGIYHDKQIAFVSVGEKNIHHHPSPTAINEIFNTCGEVHIVTEDSLAFEREFILD